jgi:hypothetical protein
MRAFTIVGERRSIGKPGDRPAARPGEKSMRVHVTLLCATLALAVAACGGPPTKQEIRESTTTFPTAQPSTSTGMCTMDAMQCPDGSYVGRVPPSCNFAPCP